MFSNIKIAEISVYLVVIAMAALMTLKVAVYYKRDRSGTMKSREMRRLTLF